MLISVSNLLDKKPPIIKVKKLTEAIEVSHNSFFLSFAENECIDYRILDSEDRSKAHPTSGKLKYCDHWNFGFASKRWYRFTGEAGQTMADKCVKPMRCQTLMSGWMDGKHPEVGLQTVMLNIN